VTVVVLVPGLGDDVQALKAGVLEIADVFAINKSDLPGAERLEQEIRAMQSLANASEWESTAPIQRVIANDGTGIPELWSVILGICEKQGRKSAQAEIWISRLRELLRERLDSELSLSLLDQHARQVAAKNENPYQAAEALWASLR
jgi:LAO/AO transport system kinase